MNGMITEPQKLWNRNFLLLWQSQAISVFGDILYSIAIGFWVYRETGSEGLMGVMASISMFVSMFLSPFAGAIVDRLNRKSVLVSMNIIRGLIMIWVALLTFNEQLSIPVVFIAAFAAALCGAFFSPAMMTSFVELVPKSELVRAQSVSSGTNSLIQLVGKGASGALVVYLGVGPMILLNGLSFLFFAVSILFIQIPKGALQGDLISFKSVLGAVMQGARDTISTPGLNTLILSALFANLLGSGYLALMIPLAFQKGITETEYGFFIAASSLAAVLGMALLGVVKIPPKLKFKLFVWSFTIQSVIFVIAFMGYGFWWLTVFFFIGDFLNVIGNSLLNATMILAIPREKRATVLGFVSSFSIAGMAISTLAYGFLAEVIDLSLLASFGSVLGLIALIPVFIDKGIKQMFLDQA